MADGKLKQGDRVVMHSCIEAEDPNNYGKVWTCRTDQFTRGKGMTAQDSVFLEGYGSSFAPEFLQKVSLPSEDERILAELKEMKFKILHANFIINRLRDAVSLSKSIMNYFRVISKDEIDEAKINRMIDELSLLLPKQST
ncbi:hypothetical protein [Paenibacillus sp. FSL L8-0463]|uniref:hypothetical protein n=1 Tax=Paenibacillus sp. FSL L8-0463 TaxID=2954687 RepID=UPI0031195B00